MRSEDVYFHEVQRPRWIAVWPAAVLLTACGWGSFLPHILRDVERHGLDLAQVFLCVPLFVLGVWLPLSLVFWRLETTLKDGVVHLDARLRGRTRLDAADVRRLEVVPYFPVMDRGWGVRKGKAIRILLDEGREIRVGTQKPAELLAALEAVRTVPATPVIAPPPLPGAAPVPRG